MRSFAKRATVPRFAQAVDDLNDCYFHQLQPRLAALSTRGRLIMQDGASDPASMVEAIRQVVSELRREAR